MLNFMKRTSLYILALPLLFTALGILSNQAVLNANHDTFPVEVNTYKERVYVAKAQADYKDMADELGLDPTLPEGMIDDTHCVMTSKTHLNWLADVFDFKGDGIYSIGDFMLLLGGMLWGFAPFVWAFEVIRRLLKREDHY